MRLSNVLLLIISICLTVAFLVAGRRIDPLPPPPVSAGSSVVAKVTGPRILLEKSQQGEAASVGGFVQPPVSVLRVDRPMQYGDFIWNDDGVPGGPMSIRVDLRTQLLSVFRAGHEIGIAVVLYGADAKETPIGRFPILWKGKNHRSSLYDAPMPFTLRLTGDGVAIHGSEVRWGAATHGCIGVPTEFARHVFDVVSVSDPVMIVRSSGQIS